MDDSCRGGRHTRSALWLSATALFGMICTAQCFAAEDPPKIYRCKVDQQLIFSDRPCAPVDQSTEIVLRESNSYSAADGAPTAKTKAARAQMPRSSTDNRQNESIAAEQLRAKQRCQRLTDQLDVIQSKMRSGYSAKQGERLRDRQRQLEQQRRTERCR